MSSSGEPMTRVSFTPAPSDAGRPRSLRAMRAWDWVVVVDIVASGLVKPKGWGRGRTLASAVGGTQGCRVSALLVSGPLVHVDRRRRHVAQDEVAATRAEAQRSSDLVVDRRLRAVGELDEAAA